MTEPLQPSIQTPSTSQQMIDLAKRKYQQEELEEATRLCREILRGEPNYPEALHLLGVLAFRAGKNVMAEDLLRLAITFNRNASNYFLNLGQVVAALGRFEEGIDFAQRACAMKPGDFESHYILAKILRSAGKVSEAIASYQRAIELSPKHAHAHSNMGMAMLLKGDFRDGWRELEWRDRRSEIRPAYRGLNLPRWDGSPLEGRSIVLVAEHGFGDAIHFLRYLPLLVARGAGRIILQVQPELVRLARSLHGICEVVALDSPPPEAQVYCPLMSLPLLFETTLETVPANVPYLAADADDLTRWRARVAEKIPPGRLKVGLVWAGHVNNRADRKRSLSLEQLAPLAEIPSVQLVSLLKGPGAAAIASSALSRKLIDWTADLNDFADTAALIEDLDLVISVDTAVAHLAGALNKPVWTLIPYVPDWRWLLDREDSPWYPSMKLYRQPKFGDWATPIARIADDLLNLARGSAA